jgi:hypothetical protein
VGRRFYWFVLVRLQRPKPRQKYRDKSTVTGLFERRYRRFVALRCFGVPHLMSYRCEVSNEDGSVSAVSDLLQCGYRLRELVFCRS